jgi:hypothetical protein
MATREPAKPFGATLKPVCIPVGSQKGPRRALSSQVMQLL